MLLCVPTVGDLGDVLPLCLCFCSQDLIFPSRAGARKLCSCCTQPAGRQHAARSLSTRSSLSTSWPRGKQALQGGISTVLVHEHLSKTVLAGPDEGTQTPLFHGWAEARVLCGFLSLKAFVQLAVSLCAQDYFRLSEQQT